MGGRFEGKARRCSVQTYLVEDRVPVSNAHLLLLAPTHPPFAVLQSVSHSPSLIHSDKRLLIELFIRLGGVHF